MLSVVLVLDSLVKVWARTQELWRTVKLVIGNAVPEHGVTDSGQNAPKDLARTAKFSNNTKRNSEQFLLCYLIVYFSCHCYIFYPNNISCSRRIHQMSFIKMNVKSIKQTCCTWSLSAE